MKLSASVGVRLLGWMRSAGRGPSVHPPGFSGDEDDTYWLAMLGMYLGKGETLEDALTDALDQIDAAKAAEALS